MKQAIYYFFIFTLLLGGCVQEKSEYVFENTTVAEIDESRIVLTRFPSELREINDSIIGAMNMGTHLSLYNIFTGKNTANFSTESLSIDSLITETYRKKYANKREYIYDASASAGMSGGNAQLLNFYYTENKYYVYVNTLAEVKYVNDPEELQSFLQTANAKELNTEDVDIQIMEYLEFIFELDNQLKIKKIIPLYARTKMKANQYSPFFQKGFAVEGTQLFVPIYNSEKGFSDMSAKMVCNNQLSCLANYDLTNDNLVNYSLSYKTIDFSDFTIRNYFTSMFKFRNVDSELLFSNGKDIVDVTSEKKVFSKDRLEKNEWISDFQKNKGTITLLTYKLLKKKLPTESEKMYGADSLCDIQIKVYEEELVATKNLTGQATSFLVTANKVIFIEKDKEHYYFKSIGYHEN